VAAASLVQYLTAYFPFYELSPLAPGDAILISAASSSAGLGAIQLAKLAGAFVIASTRTSAKVEKLKAAGADYVIVTDQGEVSSQMRSVTDGTGVKIVYDAVAGAFVHDYADGVAREARIYIYGAMGGSPTIEAPILPLIRTNSSIHFHSLLDYFDNEYLMKKSLDFVMDSLKSERISPIIDRVFDFDQFQEAYEYMETGQQFGKIILKL
jgi:NADPH2:quinone reductase